MSALAAHIPEFDDCRPGVIMCDNDLCAKHCDLFLGSGLDRRGGGGKAEFSRVVEVGLPSDGSFSGDGQINGGTVGAGKPPGSLSSPGHGVGALPLSQAKQCLSMHPLAPQPGPPHDDAPSSPVRLSAGESVRERMLMSTSPAGTIDAIGEQGGSRGLEQKLKTVGGEEGPSALGEEASTGCQVEIPKSATHCEPREDGLGSVPNNGSGEIEIRKGGENMACSLPAPRGGVASRSVYAGGDGRPTARERGPRRTTASFDRAPRPDLEASLKASTTRAPGVRGAAASRGVHGAVESSLPVNEKVCRDGTSTGGANMWPGSMLTQRLGFWRMVELGSHSSVGNAQDPPQSKPAAVMSMASSLQPCAPDCHDVEAKLSLPRGLVGAALSLPSLPRTQKERRGTASCHGLSNPSVDMTRFPSASRVATSAPTIESTPRPSSAVFLRDGTNEECGRDASRFTSKYRAQGIHETQRQHVRDVSERDGRGSAGRQQEERWDLDLFSDLDVLLDVDNFDEDLWPHHASSIS